MTAPDRMRQEAWLANRLGRKGVLLDLFAGTTNEAERKRRLRAAINSRELAEVIAAIDRSSGKAKPVTYGQAFERLYGEPL